MGVGQLEDDQLARISEYRLGVTPSVEGGVLSQRWIDFEPLDADEEPDAVLSRATLGGTTGG